MSLQTELRRVTHDLHTAIKERDKAVMELHLNQEHQRDQILQMEVEFQGKIQEKSEQLKRERDTRRSTRSWRVGVRR